MKQHAPQSSQASSENRIRGRNGLISKHLLLPLLGLLASDLQAHAHVGHVGAHGFAEGLAHPLSGLDHLIAMIGVGLWAAQFGGRATWFVPLAFVAVMTVGGALGWSGIPLPFVEAGSLASIVVLGLLIASAARWPLPVCMALVGTFALFHGHAHGAEMPDDSSRLLYGFGFVLATALLHSTGIGAATMAQQRTQPIVLRYAGVCVVLAGVWLCLSWK